MKLTQEMKERVRAVGGAWKDEGGGFASLVGSHMGYPLAYVKVPRGVETGGREPRVNGGLTFGAKGMVGWDYAHAVNIGTPEQDIKTALKFYRRRAK